MDGSEFRDNPMPSAAVAAGLDAALDALARIAAALDAYLGDGVPRTVDLDGLDTVARTVVDDALGEGEVAIELSGVDRARIVEATMAASSVLPSDIS